jgi:hypothetical protein
VQPARLRSEVFIALDSLFGIQKVHAVLSFHLMLYEPDRMRDTISAVQEIGPEFVVLSHRTGELSYEIGGRNADLASARLHGHTFSVQKLRDVRNGKPVEVTSGAGEAIAEDGGKLHFNRLPLSWGRGTA